MDNPLQDRFVQLIKNDLSLYTMHTNLDIAESGVNETLAEKLKLKQIKPFDDSRCCNDQAGHERDGGKDGIAPPPSPGTFEPCDAPGENWSIIDEPL